MRGGQAGLELCRQLRTMPEAKHLPIIMLTNRGEETDEVVSLENGADDFIHKSVSTKVLSARLKNVLRRYTPASVEEATQIKFGLLEIEKTSHSVKLSGREIFLPRKEFELLWTLTLNPGKVFSREMLLRRVWGENVFVTDRTVDVHIKRLRAALGPTDCDRYIETVRGSGYRITKMPTQT
jgi:DNA-binding response OmpR family regulator